jgi:hypothetical protein
MRRSADRLALLVAATLVSGCKPETSTPPPSAPAHPDVILGPGTAGGPRAPAKKPKEPGLGNATPRSSGKRRAAL